MLRNRESVMVFLLALMLGVGSARADEITEFYDSLFGKEAAQVTATREKADDVAFGKQLLEAARGIEEHPKIVALLCEKSYEFSSRASEGYPTAIEAMNLLAMRVPQRKAECLGAIIQLQRRAYASARGPARQEAGDALLALMLDAAQAAGAAGQWNQAAGFYRQALPIATSLRSDQRTEIQQWLKQAGARQRAVKKIEDLQAKLKADPTDTAAADQIVAIYLVDLDNPKGAAEVAQAGSDAVAKKLAPLAATQIEEMTADDCLALADWYRKLGDKASPDSRPAMWNRAATYYEKFLELNTENGLARFKATAGLKQVRAKLDARASKGKPRFRQTMRGLVFWVDPNRNPATPLRDWVSSSKETNKGVTVAAVAGTKVLAFKDRAYLDYVVPKAVSSISETGTVLVWFAGATPNADTPLLNRTNGNATADLGLLIRADRLTLWQNYPPDMRTVMGSKVKLTAREWHLVGHTWDEKAATLYIDGKPDQSLAIKPPPVAGSHIIVGADFPGAAEYLNGYIGSARIFNRALSAKEIAQIYSKERPVYNVSPWTDSPRPQER